MFAICLVYVAGVKVLYKIFIDCVASKLFVTLLHYLFILILLFFVNFYVVFYLLR